MISRALSTTLAACLAYGACAQGVHVTLFAIRDLGTPWFQQGARHFAGSPMAVKKGTDPRRDPQRLTWWKTPRLRADLADVETDRALKQGIEHGDIFASINPLAVFLTFQEGGGSGGGGGTGGEGGGPGGGSGGTGGGGAGGPSAGGGSGETNTNTGNKLTTLPLVGWKARGRSGVGLALYHGSIGSYNGAWGQSWSSTYDANIAYTQGSSAILRMPDGLTLPYSEEMNGSFTPPTGYHDTLVKNANGTFTLTFTNQKRWEFDTQGRLTATKDRAGNTVTVNRDAQSRISSVSDASGRSLTFAYNAANRVSSVTDPTSRVWSFAYNASGQLTGVTYPAINSQTPTRSFTYNATNDMLTETDLRGGVWTWTYDSSERMTSFKTPLNRTTSYSYGTASATYTLPGGQQIVHNYSGGLIVSEVDPAGFSRAYTYDAQRNVLTRTDERGALWTYTYDSKGNVLTAKNPLNQTWTLAYNAANDVTSIANPMGQTTSAAYDAQGNLTQITDPLGRASVRLTYDGFGQPLTRLDAMNRTTSLQWNTNGNLTQLTDPAGITATAAYDTLGRVQSVTDAGGAQVQLAYDAWGRSLSLTQPGSATSSSTLDLEGLVLSRSDELGRTSTFTWNADGLLTQTANPRGDVEQYAYNANGWLTGITNGRGYTRTYTRTARGEAASLTMPDGAIEQWTHLGTGQVSAYTSPNAYSVGYNYDLAGRMTGVDYPTGTDTAFTYDAAGRALTMTDGTGTSSWSYDAASQLLQLAQPQGTLSYAYNTAGQRTSMTETGYGATSYAYDSAGRVASIQNHLGETTSVQYDTLGRPSRKTLSSGQYEEFAYDNRWRPTAITLKNSSGGTLRSQAYTYDAASQMLSHTVAGSTTTYGYDAANQLVSETRAGYSGAYTYDGNGNRLSRTVNGLAEAYAYDAGDKLQSVTWAGGAKTYGYDAAGRTTSVTTGAGTTNIAYDWESRITSMTGPGLSQTNAYNGLDTRVAKNAQSFLRDGAYVTDPVLKDGNATFTPGISERRGSTTTFQHSGLKNADAQSGIAQTLTATKQYDAFGNLEFSSGTWQGPFGYAGGFGYQSESDSGLMLLGHRYMDPSTGRFLTRDPVKDGRNWYGYVGNHPVTRADPAGLMSCIALMALIDPEIPPFPAGESVDDNIKEIQWWLTMELTNPDPATGVPPGMWGGGTVGVWTGSVRPGGRWDYKRINPNPEVYDDAGNFNYGATGGALGIPLQVLLAVGEVDSQIMYGKPDDEDDRRMTIAGYRYFERNH